jgi:amino acid adenylation domain-containing protein/thioester reductase-like protein
MATSEQTRVEPESPWSSSGDDFVVAVNDDGQHAVWPAVLDPPPGWRRRSASMSQQACLNDIAAAWPDIAPALPDVAPAAGFVQDLFDERAADQPDSVAVDGGAARLTYGELAASVNQLARHLRGTGVGPEVMVGVSMERGVDVIRCLLAILKAGGAYLPLDPATPAARLREMCAEAGPAVVLTAGDVSAALTSLVPFARDPDRISPTAIGLRADNIAYAIYTSGSTGRAKGVTVSHRALASQIVEVTRAFQISPGDRVLQLASLAFDTSIEQMLATLLGGATVMLPPPGTVAPTDLLRYLAERRVTVADLTPAYWHQLLALAMPDDERLRDLRLMITGGEMASAADCQAALLAAPRARLVNAYGLTETTITSTLYDVSQAAVSQAAVSQVAPVPGGRVPVGRALPHAQVLVLDGRLRQVPMGTLGEIYIGGQGVARGYLGQPGRTAERFVPNPFSTAPGARMYRTGDVGRWIDGQNLEVIGRADRQLKVRGFRVEPAEVETALAEHPGIEQAAVVAHELSPGNVQLTAYYVRRAGHMADRLSGDQLTGDRLRDFLAERLPRFMIPAEFVALHQIPRTPGGEIDQRTLANPVVQPRGSPADERYTPTQAGLSHLWSRILAREQVGLDDDFFVLGGNSLLAAEMLAHARVMFGIGPGYVRPLTRCLLHDATLRGFSAATQAARARELSASAQDSDIDVTREAELEHPIRPAGGPPPEWRRPQRVLLTGATGFFGTHLLRELLASTDAEVHCLVRARDTEHALLRITLAARSFDIDGLDLARVVPVSGDLAEPRLGLSTGEFCELAKTCDVIYHAGALVNFIYPYAELRSANVTGTREVIRLASLHRGIPVHYISTTAVLAGFGVMGVREVTEDTPLAYADQLGIGYVETKFVAEELLRNASRAGLPVAIYRPLDIVGDQRRGTWNTATEMCALIRFMTDAGLAPDIDLPLDFVPADACAAAVRYISTRTGATGDTYHLSSPRYALLDDLVNRLRIRGYQIDAMPYDEWVGELVKYAARHPAHPMTPFVPLFVDPCPDTDLTVAEMYLEHVFPSYGRTSLEKALSGSGIAFPPVDEKLLDLAIGRLMTSGYLRAPGQLCRSGYVGQTLPRLGPFRAGTGRGGRPGRVLRRPAPGQRAVRLPAWDRPAPRGRRVPPGHQ